MPSLPISVVSLMEVLVIWVFNKRHNAIWDLPPYCLCLLCVYWFGFGMMGLRFRSYPSYIFSISVGWVGAERKPIKKYKH